MVHKGKCNVKKSSSHHSNFKSEQIFYCRPFSYHFLSLSFKDVRSTFICYHTSYRIIIFRRSLRYFYCLQTPCPNYPVIPQGRKHSSLLSGFIVILSFRSVCQLCGWTVPRLVRGTSGAFRTSFVISPRYYTCYGQWSCCPVRGTIHAIG